MRRGGSSLAIVVIADIASPFEGIKTTEEMGALGGRVGVYQNKVVVMANRISISVVVLVLIVILHDPGRNGLKSKQER